MSDNLKRIIDGLSQRINAEIQGDGAATYTSAESAAISQPLTLDVLHKMMASIPRRLNISCRFIEVDPYPIYGPARRHRKRRIQKKWLKRYGRKVIGYEYPMGDNLLVDEKRGIAYCHPHVARWIRRQIPEPEEK